MSYNLKKLKSFNWNKTSEVATYSEEPGQVQKPKPRTMGTRGLRKMMTIEEKWSENLQLSLL